MGEPFCTKGAEMVQPGKARAWKARGDFPLGSSNLPLGAIPFYSIKIVYVSVTFDTTYVPKIISISEHADI